MTGVYVLIYEHKIIYVGSTTRWPHRLLEHKKILFDNARLFECEEKDLLRNETRFIKFFRPLHNFRDKFVKQRMTKEWIRVNKSAIKKAKKEKDFSEIVKKARVDLKYSDRSSSTDIANIIRNQYENVLRIKL